MTSTTDAIIAVFAMGVIIFSTRAFPFILFAKRKPPKILQFIEKYIPPMVMAVLVVYCFKDVTWTIAPYGSKELLSLVLVTILHVLKKNAMLSIFGGTAFYMILELISKTSVF